MILRLLIFILFFQSINAQNLSSRVDSVNSISSTEILFNLYKSRIIFENNLKLAQSIGYKVGEAKSLAILAIINHLMGNYEKATDYNIRALVIFDEEKDYNNLAETYGEFGYQMKRRDLRKANFYMQKGISIATNNSVKTEILTKLYDNYGVLKEMEGNLDSALVLYFKALKNKERLKDSIGIPYSLNKIANAHTLKKNFKQAFYFLNLSDKYRMKEKSDYGRADNFAYYGDFFSMQGNIDSAIAYYQKSLQLSITNGYFFLIPYCYEMISDLYQRKGDYAKSLNYYKKYVSNKDSISNAETNQKIAELEVAFESAQKDKLIAEKELLLRQRALLFIIIGTILFLITILMLVMYSYQVQKKKSLTREIELTKQISENEAKQKVFEEKLKLARELHDNIAAQLTFIINLIDNMKYSVKDENLKDKLSHTLNFARTTLNDLRNTIWAMKNESGTLSDLILKINDYINRYKIALNGLNVEVIKRLSKNYSLPSTQLTNLMRIFQECLQNIIKHSEASEAKILFNDLDEGFSMRICDNGKGIENSTTLESTGLASIKYRAEEIGCEFKIEKCTSAIFNTINPCGSAFVFNIKANPCEN